VKTHENKGSCITAKAKQDKALAQPELRLLMSFFPKVLAKPQRVPSTIEAPALANAALPAAKRNPEKITPKSSVAPVLSQSVPYPRPIQLLNQLRANVVLLPQSIAVADQTNPLSVFSGKPATYVSADTAAHELWEALSGLFHRAR
jgi:hypothetical protein